MIVYVCHDFWIAVIATLFVHPNVKENNPRVEGISFQLALFIMLFGVELLSNLTYWLMVKLYQYCSARSKKRGVAGRDHHQNNGSDKEEERAEISSNI